MARKIVNMILVVVEVIALIALLGYSVYYFFEKGPGGASAIIIGALTFLTAYHHIYYFILVEIVGVAASGDEAEEDETERIRTQIERILERAEGVQGFSMSVSAVHECERQAEQIGAIVEAFERLTDAYGNSGVVEDANAALALLNRRVSDNIATVLNLYDVILNGGVADSDMRQINRCLNENQQAIIRAQELQLIATRYVNTLFHEGGDAGYDQSVVDAFNYAMITKIDQAAIREMDRQIGELNTVISATMSKIERAKENLNLA